MNYLDKIKRIVKEVEKKYPSGDKFFNEVDKQLKMSENIDLTIQLFKKIEKKFGKNYNIVISGGWGRYIIDLIERKIINIKGSIIQLSGGITSHKTDMDKIKKVKSPSMIRTIGNPQNKDFIFIDDSYYSGTTEKIIKDWVKSKFNSEIIKTFVIYDGNDKTSKDRTSLYRYYDWNVGTKRSYKELTKELSNYKEILPYKEFSDLKDKIRKGDIISIIQLRKNINEITPIDVYKRIRENNNLLKYIDFYKT
jgi:pyrimidine operon attenuation protein/uracil phosphoribosyltransferase